MAKHEIREGGLTVSLTDDAYDYNDKFFTLEVTEMSSADGVENDADVSGLPVTAAQEEISNYLEAAMACAKVRCGAELSVRNVAGYAAQAGIQTLKGNKPKGPSLGR